LIIELGSQILSCPLFFPMILSHDAPDLETHLYEGVTEMPACSWALFSGPVQAAIKSSIGGLARIWGCTGDDAGKRSPSAGLNDRC